MMPKTERPSAATARHHSLMGLLFGLSLHEQALFFRQLASMIDAGVISGKALQTLAEQRPGHFGRVLAELSQVVNQGEPLSTAMRMYPEYFSEFSTSLIAAGEVGGSLDDRLRDLADWLERSYKARATLVTMLIYPIVVMHAAILLPPLVVLVMQGVVPYLRTVLPILASGYALMLGIHLIRRLGAVTQPLRLMMDSVVIMTPVLGGLARTGAAQAFARALGELLEAGIANGTAVEVAGRACGNEAFALKAAAIVPALREGASLSSQIVRARIFSPSAAQMLVAAEQSGAVGQTLKKVSDFLGIEYDEALKRTMVLLSVFLLFVVGGVVGYQYIKTFLNIFAPLEDIM